MNLPKTLTPVTLETFQAWKKRRLEQKQKEEAERSKQREAAIRAGKSIGASGRELFTYNPEAFNLEDEDEAMEIDYTHGEEESNDESMAPEIDTAAFEGVSLEDLDVEDDEE